MHIIGNSVNETFARFLREFHHIVEMNDIRPEDSRNGPVYVVPGPVLTEYRASANYVIDSSLRNANPFFHFFEGLWMLAGRRDVALLARFNRRMQDYSDDGTTLHGAYGYRWKTHFHYDQLEFAVGELRSRPSSRRVVISMWDPNADIEFAYMAGKDVPCNTHIYAQLADGALDLTVCCRSNDALWGAYGSNVVHFSMLHQYLAERIEVPVGRLFQFANNMHIYADKLPLEKWLPLADDLIAAGFKTMKDDRVRMQPRTDYDGFEKQLSAFLLDPSAIEQCGQPSPYLLEIAVPMLRAWRGRHSDLNESLEVVKKITSEMWRHACYRWLIQNVKFENKPTQPLAQPDYIPGA